MPVHLRFGLLERDRIGLILPLHQACAASLVAQHGDGHWGHTPTLESLERDASTRSVYAAWEGDVLVATFRLSLDAPVFLKPTAFRFPGDSAAYLTSLAVAVAHQRRGIGRACLEYAEVLAREWYCDALRFDAYDGPAGAGGFYRRCGYTCVGPLTVRGVPLLLFEKVLCDERRNGV